MKLIEDFKSPNFNNRKDKSAIRYIILHYTALNTYKEALEHMCNKKNKVSSHFLISKKGQIFYIVKISKRAWHAGKSYWKGSEDLNSSSIGIEIDNSGHHNKNEDYGYYQIKSLCKLIKFLINKYNISKHNIIGHSDVAPFRKIDPGEKFPWYKLAKKNLCYLPNMKKNNSYKNHYIKSKIENHTKQDIINMLKFIGYDTRNANKKNQRFKSLITSYQRHYRPSCISGKIDSETSFLIEKHHKDLLT